MALLDILFRVVVGVVILVAVSLLVVVGANRVRVGPRNVRHNLGRTGTAVVILAVVLGANSVVRQAGVDLSWIIGVNITGYIHAIEGNFVPWLQSMATPALTLYFSFVYVVGYTFLLTFPFIAYLLLDDPTPFRELVTAYIVNYGVGLVAYILFVAYGPRNFLPDLVDSLLYTFWPQSQLITSQVNSNTNVFPSLHASLSATVFLLAYRTRNIYPRWVPVAAILAISICISTMYLGIHWLTDVVAGIGLAVLSVHAAKHVTHVEATGSHWLFEAEDRLTGRLSELNQRFREN